MKIEVREGNFSYAKKREIAPFIYEANISFT